MGGTPDPAALEAELARVRAERDALQARLAELEAPRTSRLRSPAVGVLVVLVCLGMVGSVVGVWARRSALNDAVFDERVAPLGEDPRVKEALAQFLTREVMVTIDPETIFREALPDRAQILAVPLANTVEGFVADQVRSFLDTDEFERLWASATTQAHAAAVDVLEGESAVVGTDGDTLVINLVPIINRVLARIGEQSPEIFGRTVDLPTLTVDDLPKDAIDRLADALGVTLPDDFGTIRVREVGGSLAAAQDALRIANRLVLASVVVTVVALPLALWLSRRRRRTLLQLVGGLAVTFVLFRRIGWRLEADLLDRVRNEVDRDAVDAVLTTFLDPLWSAVTVVLWILAAIAVVALVTGPYGWAVRLRAGAVQLGTTLVGAAGSVGERATRAGAVAWVRRHLAALQVAGGIVALLLLLTVDLSWWTLLVLVVLAGAYQWALWQIGQRAPGDLAPLAPDGVAPPATDA